mmetsp:Transcript_13598/g.15011  ORF Transcript_13598/g.15011 Transcript_13598/m.15011 type:complete len:110 (+) Transcript_13598:77-406(+)
MASMYHFVSGKKGTKFFEGEEYVPPGKMRVSCLFFREARKVLGTDELIIEVPIKTTNVEFKQILSERYPKLSAILETGIVAVGNGLNRFLTTIKPGDVVGLMENTQMRD